MTREQWIARGKEDKQLGLSRYYCKRWLKVSATIEQEKWYWLGYDA